MTHRNLLIFVAREPIPGFTKTRLGRTIGMERAAALYRAFLADLAARFGPVIHDGRNPEERAAFDLCWAFTPAGCDFAGVLSSVVPLTPQPPSPRFGRGQAKRGGEADRCCSDPGFGRCPSDRAVRFVAQEGDSLAARLNSLLRWGRRQGYERTVVAATDSPQLTVEMVAEGFAALADHDVAIGRVHDGGYYQIGLRGYHDVLSGTPIGTTSAADALVARAEALGLQVGETTPTFDIDEEADLTLLYEHLLANPTAAPATWAALDALGLIPVGAVSGRRSNRSRPVLFPVLAGWRSDRSEQESHS